MTTDSLPQAASAPTNGHAAAAPSVADTVARLRKTFASGRTRSYEWRKHQLEQLTKLVEENEPAIGAALAEDLDRNEVEAFIADIATTTGEAKYAAKKLKKWMRRKYLLLEAPQLPGRGWVEYEPFGTVLIIGAWNYPFYLTLGPAVGALAAGNAVILKPSELAPASSKLMAELVPKYLDQDAVAVVEGDGIVSQELISQGLDRVMFTGGTEIGRKVYEGAARHLTPVTLELGGKSPVVVAADGDIDVAAKRIAWLKILNAGQTCVAPDYVLADASIRDELVDKIAASITKFRAKDNQSGMRVVNERQFNRLSGYLSEAEGDGSAKVAVGGKCDAATLRIQPTVVVDPSPEGSLMQNEIFGPLLPILTVKNLDEAIDFINAREKPLSAYLFTKSKATRERFIKEVPAGGMLINHLAFQVSTAKLPFGGVGASGMGAYHGKWGFDEFSHRKSVLTKPTRPDFSAMIYPPYTARAFKLARKLF